MSATAIHVFKAVAVTALLGLCLQAHAGERTRAGSDQPDAQLRTVLAYELADVKSRQDLAAHLQRTGDKSPLNALSPTARERFLDSLSFNDKGLVHYRYDDLQSELTATQAYRILRLFGAEQSAPFMRSTRVKDDVDAGIVVMRIKAEDHDRAKCISPGTCEKHNPNHICTSNC